MLDKKNLRGSKVIFGLLLCILSVTLYSQTTPPPQKSEINKKDPVNSDSFKQELFVELAKKLSNYAENVSNVIYLLSIFLILLSVLAPFIIWFSDRKNREKIKLDQEKIQGALKEIEKRIMLESQSEIAENLKAYYVMFKGELKEQAKHFERTLLDNLDYEAEPIEKRFKKAETIRNDMWDLLVPKLKEALESNDWPNFLEGWTDFHKLQLALSQIISRDEVDIYNGLGTFNNLCQSGFVPDSLLDLVYLLESQNRLETIRLKEMVKRLERTMGRRRGESPEAEGGSTEM
jgi:hypothetical protein